MSKVSPGTAAGDIPVFLVVVVVVVVTPFDETFKSGEEVGGRSPFVPEDALFVGGFSLETFSKVSPLL